MRWLWVIVGFACQQSSRPATVTDLEIAVTERELATIRSLADSLDAQEDCARKIPVMEQAAPSIAALARDVAAMVSAPPTHDQAADTWMDKHYKRDVRAASERVHQNVRSCHDDPAFMRAFAPLAVLWRDVTL